MQLDLPRNGPDAAIRADAFRVSAKRTDIYNK